MNELEYTIYEILLDYCDGQPVKFWGAEVRLIHDHVIEKLGKMKIPYNPVTIYNTIEECMNKLLQEP